MSDDETGPYKILDEMPPTPRLPGSVSLFDHADGAIDANAHVPAPPPTV